jgi:N-acetylglucosamine kinase-like BadF-type ATPase
VETDLDLCARIYGEQASARRAFAQFAQLVDEAARGGDPQALAILERAADELVQCVIAVRRALAVPDDVTIPVSHSGGVLQGSALTLEAFRALLGRADRPFEYRVPRYPPEIGAALYAARLAGRPLGDAALSILSQSGPLS